MRKKSTLTAKQKKVLDFIVSFNGKNGYSPSLSEISKKLKKSVPTIFQFVKTLNQKGYLQKTDHIWRGISTEIKKQVMLLGTISAGQPIQPFENPEPIDVPASMILEQANYYALKVQGDSMIEDGILGGDTILVKHQMTADDGDTIVAITEKGATLKMLRKGGGKVYLEPRNKNLKNIYPKELEIRGKFCGLIRSGDL
ncbi:MAG: transcriptional repressor LexA [Candidatus Beckwithbacteria bacterium]|nr:transcriptional repressor LexA [Patescibacteria group bacterium]